MRVFLKTLAALTAALFILTAVISLILFNFDRKAFTAATYQKAFANADFYNQLPAIMANTILTSSAQKDGFPIVMRGMSETAWENFFRALLPQEMLKAMGDEVLNSIFAYINMQSNTAVLSLVPLKESMVGEAGVQAAISLLAELPDCTLEQIGQMTLGVLSSSEIQFCNPPAEMLPILIPIIQGQMQVTAQFLPDQYTLISIPAARDPRVPLQRARLGMRLSPILPLGLLFLMTLMAVNSLKSWLKWWGIPLLITGLILALTGLLGGPIVGNVIQRLLNNGGAGMLPAILMDHAGNLAQAMVKTLLVPVLWQGGVLFLIGVLMLIGGLLVREKLPTG